MKNSSSKPRPNPIAAPDDSQKMFVTWDEGDKIGRAAAMHEASKAVDAVEPIRRAHATDVFSNVEPSMTIRDGYSRQDYDYYRPDEAIPRKPKDIIRACMHAYNRVGIVKNVVDMMAEFATQGIDLYHPNERIEKFYQQWFKKVGGKERSERFCNLLYRSANVIVKRSTAKLPLSEEEKMKRAKAAPEEKVDDSNDPMKSLGKREVPWRYTFLNPLALNVLAEELSLFIGPGQFIFALAVPPSLSKRLKTPSKKDNPFIRNLPKDILDAIRRGESVIELDPLKVKAFYYKRDDWDVWAKPMIYPILPDIRLLEKMKLADTAALDGAMSSIRVWKLGNIENRILPTGAAIEKLASMLANNVGGGVMDLVWGPEIELVQTKTDVHQFLGKTKYEPCLIQIFAGLGVPPTLTGADAKGGFTNNFISLKVLTERLQYGRDVLTEFWDEEIRLVQKSMGFRFPATVVYDRMTLSDPAAEKQLLLHMWDRGLVSDETIVEHFGEAHEIEEARVRRDERKRANGQKPPKASPFHDPEQDYGLKKIFAQTGVVTPSEVGVELDEGDKDEKSLLDHQQEQTVKQTKLQNDATKDQMDHQYRTEKLQLKHGVHPTQLKPTPVKTGVSGQGRPKNAKDSQKRKQKTVKPRTSAAFFSTMAWAENAQAQIMQLAAPAYLKARCRKNMRELTNEEAKNFETFKFHALCNIEPGTEVTKAVMTSLLKQSLTIPVQVNELLKATIAKHVEDTGHEPTLDVLRRFQAGVVALYKGKYEDE